MTHGGGELVPDVRDPCPPRYATRKRRRDGERVNGNGLAALAAFGYALPEYDAGPESLAGALAGLDRPIRGRDFLAIVDSLRGWFG